MVTMLYGVEVRVHFLDNHKNPQVESTEHFLRSSLPNSKYLGDVHCRNPISVLFHQYNKMNHCFHDRYNHFAMLLSFPGCPADPSMLINNNLVAIEQPENQQWWKQAPQKGKEKTVKKKSEMTKVERKQHQVAVTSKYLGCMPKPTRKKLHGKKHWSWPRSIK